jgi:hypothetical protein
VLLFPVALCGGVVIGLLRGGRLASLATLPMRGGLLVGFAVGLQIAAGQVPEGGRFAVVLASYAVLGLWFLRNTLDRPPLIRAGIALLAAGWALNIVVMALNGGMPVSTAALAAVEEHGEVAQGHLWKHIEADADTRLPWLGDSIAVPIIPFRSVISAGDVAMLVGVGLTAAAALGHRPRRRSGFAVATG